MGNEAMGASEAGACPSFAGPRQRGQSAAINRGTTQLRRRRVPRPEASRRFCGFGRWRNIVRLSGAIDDIAAVQGMHRRGVNGEKR